MKRCIRVEHLAKSFFIPRKTSRIFGVVRSWITHKEFTQELNILRDINFQLDKGEKVALVGENGSGKTTLVRILSGIYTESSGLLEVNGSVNIFLKTGVGVFNDLSVIDNTYVFGAIYGMDRKLLKNKIDEILNFAGLYDLRYCPEKELSEGQIQRHILSVLLTVFIYGSDDCLIFDDSLAFVDQNFIKKCENQLKRLFVSDKTIIVAAHDKSFLRKYCDRAIWLDKGIIRKDGNVNSVLDDYEKN